MFTRLWNRYMRIRLQGLVTLAMLIVLIWGPWSATEAQAADINIGCDVAELIAAINSANVNGIADTIHLAAGCTYTLTAVDNNTDGPNGLPSITSEIAIEGNQSTIERSWVSGIPAFRIFHVGENGSLTLSQMSVSRGRANGFDGYGGGIYNAMSGSLRLVECVIEQNYAEKGGGGIFNGGYFDQDWDATLELIDSTLKDNWSCVDGGGIFNNGGTVAVISSTLHDNWASDGSSTCSIGRGGAIYNGPTFFLGSDDGKVQVSESTISGNVASHGGGVHNTGGTVFLSGSTIANNEAFGDAFGPEYAGVGGGIADEGGTVALVNSIVAGNVAATEGDCSGTITSNGHNLDSDGTCDLDPLLGDLPDVDPMVGVLENNGGSTWTHALLSGSPAIDAGDDAACPDADQRGVSRPRDGDSDGFAVCDIGAYEAVLIPVTTAVPDVSLGDSDCSLIEAINEAQSPGYASDSGDCYSGSLALDVIDLQADGPYQVSSVDNHTDGPNGLPSITSQIVIYGRGATVESTWAAEYRLFHVAEGGHLTLNELIVSDGYAPDDSGGCIYNSRLGTLRLLGSTVRDCYADKGGAIFNDGWLDEDQDGVLELVESTIRDSSSCHDGGGIHNNGGTVTVTKSTIHSNEAGHGSMVCGGSGGGIYNGAWPLSFSGHVQVSNSTISGNDAAYGGGIGSYGGTIVLIDSTISDNGAWGEAGDPGYGGGVRSWGETSLYRTIIGGNRADEGGDCVVDTVSSIDSLDSDGTCKLDPTHGDLSDTDPLLGPLQDNNGPTWTHALLSGSPAIDAVSMSGCPAMDQRGMPRPRDGDGDGVARCDIGAYERQGPATPEDDYPDTCAEASEKSYETPLRTSGLLDYAGDQDWMLINVSGAGKLEVTVSGFGLPDQPYVDVDLEAWNDACTERLASSTYRTGTHEKVVLRGTAERYKIRVFGKTQTDYGRQYNVRANFSATAIDLISFTAHPAADYVTLTWETGSETDNAGFNLWRSEVPSGDPGLKLNPALIAARGEPGSGASYDYTDDTVVEGVTYWYRLEDVDYYGTSTMHGPVSATPGQLHILYLPNVNR